MSAVLDRLPPQSLEAEEAVLGSILIDRDAIIEVADFLRPEDFYRQAHGKVYAAILELWDRREPLDIVTVAEVLERTGDLDAIGGRSFLASLSERTPTAVHVVPYARIVERKAVLRNLIGAAGRIAGIGYEDPAEVQEAIDRAESALFAVSQRRVATGFLHLRALLHDAYDRLDYLHTHRGEINGVSTGFKDLDQLTTGLQKSDLIIIAARPSVGKTSFALNIAEHAAVRERKSVAVFSLEMSKEQLVLRLLSSVANIDSQRLRSGFLEELDFARIAPAMNSLSEAPVYIDDTPNISTMELRTKARRLQAEAGLDLVIVDYLQLMQAPTLSRDSNRVQEVSEISRGLKGLARELQVPVVALSQLSRQTEMRESREPRLSDLRECVTGDTLVNLADGRRIPVRELVGQAPRVLSVDPRGRIVQADAECVWSVGVRPVLEVTLASGRRLRATADHRVLAGEGWRKLGELPAGERLAIARTLPEPNDAVEWPDDHVVLLGQLIGDGSFLNNAPMRCTTSSEENSAAVTLAATRGFGARVVRYRGRGSWHQLLIAGNGNRWHPAGVNRWLRELGIFGQRSHQKRIPREAFRLSNRQIALLLRHLWATDGCIHVARGRNPHKVFYATNSPGLAQDVAALLLRVGIVARSAVIRQGAYRPSHHVVVSGGDSQRRFVDVVGAFGPRVAPAVALQEALTDVRPNTNVDTLPRSIWRQDHRAAAVIGLSDRALQAIRERPYSGRANYSFAPSRSLVMEYAEVLGDQALMREATNDLYWDRITSVVPAGHEEVFDLTVPGPNSWLADGQVNHNSGALEQDSDLVVFLWREKERGSEDQDADGEVVKVKLAKHRNGPTGELDLWFKKSQTRFVGYAGDRYEAKA